MAPELWGQAMAVDFRKPAEVSCPVCGGRTGILDVVDFNKSCLEKDGQRLQASGMPIYYNRCPDCGFILAPQMWDWSREDFVRHVYNDDYALVDPDYADVRPRGDLAFLQKIFPSGPGEAEHLDYGSGGGLLVDLLREQGWRSTAYDPLVHGEDRPAHRFGLITAFEVFEHVPSVERLMGDLKALAAEDEAIVLFTTMVSDHFIDPARRLDWWYAAPRNGHISLYTYDSLKRLAIGAGWGFASFSNILHGFCTRTIPPWARHALQAEP
jgi:Methyltransferase domain